MMRPLFLLALRCVWGGVFVYSGYLKLPDPDLFQVAIESYDIPLLGLEMAMAYGIPVIELFIGIMLILGLWTSVAWIWFLTLLLIFDVALLQAFFRHLPIDCGCFGSQSDQGVTFWKLFQNGVLTLGSIVGVMCKKEDVFRLSE